MEHDIGSKIKAARLEKKLTQEQVAELLGVSRQTISNWENEKSYPDIITKSALAMIFCGYFYINRPWWVSPLFNSAKIRTKGAIGLI